MACGTIEQFRQLPNISSNRFQNGQKLRLHLAFIKASLSTENPCSPIGWVVPECDLSVTVFYAKAVYVRAMDGTEARRLSNDLLEKN
jgi:hypothetical protein